MEKKGFNFTKFEDLNLISKLLKKITQRLDNSEFVVNLGFGQSITAVELRRF